LPAAGEAERVSKPPKETARGATLWLGAALMGGLGAAVILNILHGGGWTSFDLAGMLGLGIISLLWTVPASALVTLAFAWSGWSGTSAALRRALLVPLAAIAGAVFMSFFEFQLLFGFVYGAATALAWGALQWALYGRR